MSAISRLLEAVGVRYEIYRIYVQEGLVKPHLAPPRVTFERINGAVLSLASEEQIRALASYDRPTEAYGFGALVDNQIQCACWYWTGETYAKRGFWPLEAKDAKLVQIVTADNFKGRGLATALIEWSSAEMAAAGFSRRFARIWHSNKSSIRAFEKARWRSLALVATTTLPCTRSFLRLEKAVDSPLRIAIGKSS